VILVILFRSPGLISLPSIGAGTAPQSTNGGSAAGGSAMVGHIVGAGIRSRVLVVILALAATVFGVLQLRATTVEALPEFAPVTVEVQSEALGLSAQEVEDLVTVPLEGNLLSGVAWVDRMQSSSIPGLSSIVMTFEPGTDEIRARQVVQERLTQGALLTNASKSPVMLQPTSAANRVMMIGLSSKDKSLIDLSVLSRWTIRPKLMSVEGVANVAVWGMRDRQLHVQADPARMQQHGVSLDELVATTGNALWVSPLSFLEASTPGRGGFLDLPQQRVNVQHVSPITDTAALGRVAVEGASGKGVALADVATIVEAPPTIIGDGIVGNASGLVLVVEKQPGVNTAEVSRGIQKAIEALSVGLPGVTIDASLYRPADYVAQAGRNLTFAGLLALLLIALGSAAIYRAWRPVVSVTASTGLAFVVGWLLLWLRGEPVNLVALGGLGAGTVIALAQSVAAVDRLSRSQRVLTPTQRVAAAYGGIGVDAIYTALAAGLLMVPVLLLSGRDGAFLPEVAVGFLLAMAGSVIVSLAAAPAITALLGGWSSRGRVSTPPRIAAAVSVVVRRLAESAAGIVAVLVVGVLAFAAMAFVADVQTRPAFQEPTLVLRTTAPAGTSPQSLTTTLGALSAKVRAIDGVADVGGHIGRAVTGERIVGANSGELWITLKEGADPATRERVSSAALAAARAAGELNPTIGTYLDGRLDALLPASAGPLVVSVYGPNPTTLKKSATEVLAIVAKTVGVTGARMIDTPTEDNIQITVNLDKTAALGMTPGDVRRQASTLVGGLEVGAIFEEQKVFDVQVWTAPDLRNSPEKVRQLPIDTPAGTQVALGDVAAVEVTKQPTVIRRESVQRRIDIVADTTEPATAGALTAALKQMNLPAEYHAEVRAEAADVDANHRRVLVYAVAALLGILLLLQAATRNWWTAVTATVAIPVGAVGGLLVALARGDVSLGAFAGLAALAILGVHNALTVCRPARVGDEEPGPAALATATGAVLPATMLTILTALGVAVLGSRAGLESLHDAALVVAGGAVTSALVALFLLPAIASRYGGREESTEDFSFDDEALHGHQGVGAHA